VVLYLARHCETAWNLENRWQGQTDIGLNEAGRASARDIADRLRGHGIARLVSSDLARAAQTAQIIAEVLGLGEVTLDPDLRERRFGVFEGLTRDECATRWPADWERYRSDHTLLPPGAEPDADVVPRMTRAVLRAVSLASDHRPGLIISHGAAMRTLLRHFGVAPQESIRNGSIFRLSMDHDRIRDAAPLP
jgi:probable phosphoglycerate mutase